MTSDDHPLPSAVAGRRRPVWLYALLVVVLLLAAASAAIWHWRLMLAEAALHGAADAAGIELAGVSVERLDSAGAHLSNLRFGAAGVQHIAAATISWSVAELFERKLRAIEISGANLRATIGPAGGLQFDGLPPIGQAKGAAGELAFPKNIPLDRLRIVHSRIVLALPDGVADIEFDAVLDLSAAALDGEASARYAADTQRGRGSGTAAVSLVWAEAGAVQGDIDLRFDRLITAQLAGTDIRLSGQVTGAAQRLENLSARARASAATIEGHGVTAERIALAAELSDGTLSWRGDAHVSDWAIEASARLNPFDLRRPATFAFKGQGDAATLAQRIAHVSAAGNLAIEMAGEIGRPLELFNARAAIINTPATIADHVVARFKTVADLRTVAAEGVFTAAGVAGEISGQWRDGILDADISEPTRVVAVALAPHLQRRLAAWLPDAQPFDIAVTAGMGSPATVSLSRVNGSINARAIGGFDVSFPQGQIVMEADGSARARTRGALDRFDVAALKLAMTGVPTVFGTASGDVLVTDLSGEGDTLAGIAAGKASLLDASARPLTARRLDLEFDTAFRASPDEMQLTLSPGGWVAGQDVQLPNVVALPGRTELRLAKGEHRLALDRRKGEIAVALRLEPGASRVRLPNADLSLTQETIEISGRWPGRLSFAANDVGVALDAERSVAVARLRVRADGSSTRADVAMSVDDAVLAVPGLTLPALAASGKLRRRGATLSGDVEIVAAGGQPTVQVRGEHNLESGSGRAEIVDAQLRFVPGVLQPGDLSPLATATVENVFATVSLTGPVAWQRGGAIAPDLTLTIDELALSTENLELFNAGVTVQVIGLPALQSPPGQRFSGQLRVGRLEPVPLDVSFQLLPGHADAGPQLVVEQLATQVADGRLTTNRFALTPPSIDTDVTLHLERADLARVFALIGVAGLGGTGRVGGDIPLQVRGEQVAIANGRLAGDGPGELFYDITALPPTLIEREDTVSLVLRALSNFAYNDLSVEMDKALDGPGSLRVHLSGANPQVLESHPFVFNITLQSNFDRLAALVLEGLTTSQGVLRALALTAGGGAGAATSP